jgi:hypothetical protein
VIKMKEERKSGYVYNIYTMPLGQKGHAAFPVGITDGFIAADKYSVYEDGSLDMENPIEELEWNATKSKCQSSFPLAICHKALAMVLEHAAATVKQDRIAFLNSIMGNDNFSPLPQESCVAYDQLNASLQGKIVELLYRTALEQGDKGLELFRQKLRASSAKKLTISFKGCHKF